MKYSIYCIYWLYIYNWIYNFFTTTVLYSKKARAGNSLIAHFLISLKSNDRLWAIGSDRSRQLSDCERIAQVAQDKWGTVSEWLRSLMTNEGFAQVAHDKWANCSFLLRKSLTCSFLWANRLFAHFFAKNERFAQKTDERIPSPEESPTRHAGHFWGYQEPCKKGRGLP